MNFDVVVIGAGLSGLSAASAALGRGKSVAIVAKGSGNLSSASGHIQLLGHYPPEAQGHAGNPEEAIKTLIRKNPLHPYALLGIERIRDAVARFLKNSESFGLPYGGSLLENRLIPTSAGTLIPAALTPPSSWRDFSEASEIVVAGFKELIDFYPAFVAESLASRCKAPLKHLWVEMGTGAGRGLNSYDMALYMEKPEALKSLASQLKPHVKEGTFIFIPAVLGVTGHLALSESLESGLGCPVIELVTLPPSVPGHRLAEAFRRHLLRRGVEFLWGHDAVLEACNGKRCISLELGRGTGKGFSLKGRAFVLATGGVLGEGLMVLPGKIEETVLGIPVHYQKPFAEGDFLGSRELPLAMAGIKVNKALQPLSPETGEVLFENVHVAGRTLAGYDPYLEKSDSGVALATGYAAGLNAAGEDSSDDH
ncbi:MAG: anaerobic glycerol-3-phosphate dehydrogenase subunit GlpB [Candidatus Eremiobacteraeota bacterium]|nr:anaerobic glycerol-3-phosphate dehydrogenase subunit GlpB [Candidatus Eremiobacteraeota bacterium]